MTTCIIAEKPSVARDIARIVGATTKQDGYLAGNGYLVTWAMGHLITLAMPEAYGYSNYKAEELPICPNPFQLIVRQVRKDKEYHEDPAALKQLKAIGSCFNQADRIIVATDAGREGELILSFVSSCPTLCLAWTSAWTFLGSILHQEALEFSCNQFTIGSCAKALPFVQLGHSRCGECPAAYKGMGIVLLYPLQAQN